MSGVPRFNKHGTECTWFGVTCDSTNHVASINLDSNGLQGELPSLGALSQLEYIVLPNNALAGPIPSDIVLLQTLISADFRTNHLSGQLPNFSGLQYLNGIDVTDNQLSGEIGPLEDLPSLQSLELSNNQFSGQLPSFAGLYLLTTILVDHNQFTGPLPDFSLSNVSTFWADHNLLAGSLPPPSETLALIRHSARLCPNPLDLEPGRYDDLWAYAIGETPWWGPPGGGCDGVFSSDFDSI
jgi:hypothetical protein